MIHVDVRYLKEHCQQLHRCSEILRRAEDEIRYEAAKTQPLMEMDRVAAELDRLSRRLSIESVQLHILTSCLLQVSEEYERSERRVDDEIEDTQARIRFHTIKAVEQRTDWVAQRLGRLIV